MTKNTKLKAAKIISTIFVPPTFTILVIPFLAFKYEYLFLQRWSAIFIAFTFGFAIQIVAYYFFIKKRKMKSFDKSNNEERTIPYLIQIGFYMIGLLLLLYFDVEHLIIVFWFTYIVNNLFCTLINYRWKISSHSIGVAQHFSLFVYLMNPVYWVFIPIAFSVGWARMELKVHDRNQILGGLTLGLILTYLLLYILL